MLKCPTELKPLIQISFSLRWRTKRYLPPGSLKGWQERRWCGKPCAPLLPGDIKSVARQTTSEVLQKCFFPKMCKPQSLGLFRKKIPVHLNATENRYCRLFWNVHTVKAHGHSSACSIHRAVTVCTLEEVEKAQPLKRSLAFLSVQYGSFFNSFSCSQRSISDCSEQDASSVTYARDTHQCRVSVDQANAEITAILCHDKMHHSGRAHRHLFPVADKHSLSTPHHIWGTCLTLLLFLLLFRIFLWRNENKSTTNLQGKNTQVLDVNLQLSVTERAKDPAPVPHSIFLTGELFVQPSLFFVNSFLTAVRSFLVLPLRVFCV